MNWWVIGVGILYCGATISSFAKGHYAYASVWACYALSAFFLTLAEGK